MRGGEIIAQGTPEEVAEVARSYTGQYLNPILAESPQQLSKAREIKDDPKFVRFYAKPPFKSGGHENGWQ